MRHPAVPLALGLLLGAGLLADAGGAVAQLAPQSHGPVDVTADHMDVQNQKCLAIGSGSAEALQDTSRLSANTISVYNKLLPPRTSGSKSSGDPESQNCGQLDRMEADGQVYYVTPDQIVKGDHAVYIADDKTIVFTGDVVVTQGKDVSAGARLVINTDTGVATFSSDVTGRGKAGRVRTVVYPNQSPSSAAKPGGSKSPAAAPSRPEPG